MLRHTTALLAIMLLGAAPSPSPGDLAGIDLAKAIVAQVGDAIWPAWSTTRFTIVLLTPNGPATIDAPQPFPVPSFPPNLEASFPLNGVPTIVIGEAGATAAKTATRWTVTLLHEHFHQWQNSWPPYFTATDALGLAPPGDESGMWMLNYPFPYADPDVDRAYAAMTTALGAALDAVGTSRFQGAVANYAGARAAFKAALKPADYRYFAFQCWMEGVARYTEFAVARLASEAHAKDPSFLTGEQAAALASDAASTYDGVRKRLSDPLRDGQRVDFYAVGAAEALILDQTSPGWHQRYLDPRMDLGVYLPS